MESFEQLKSLTETSRNASRQLAELMMLGQEQIARVNIDALEDYIKAGSNEVKETLAELSRDEQRAAWPNSFIENIKRGTALNLSLIEITRRLHQELTSAFEENLRAVQSSGLETVEQFASLAKTSASSATKLAPTASRRQRASQDELKVA